MADRKRGPYTGGKMEALLSNASIFSIKHEARSSAETEEMEVEGGVGRRETEG